MTESNDLRGALLTAFPFSHAMDMRLIETSPNEAILMIPYAEKLVADKRTGILSGGAITALLDTCSGAAVMAAERRPASTATLDLRIDYMKPATPGRDVYAHARCHRQTNTVGFVRAVAYHEDRDDPIATASAAFIMDYPDAKS